MNGEGSQRRLGEQTFPPHSPPALWPYAGWEQRPEDKGVDGATQVHVPGHRADWMRMENGSGGANGRQAVQEGRQVTFARFLLFAF